MTTLSPTENTQQIGAQGVPTPEASQPVGAGASQGTDTIPDWAKDLVRRVDDAEKVSRSKQSEVDKKLAAGNKDYKQSIEPIVESARRSMNLDEAQTATFRNQLIQDEMQRRVFGVETAISPASPALQGSEAVGAASIGEWDVLQKSQMSTNDPQVIQAVLSAKGDPIVLAMSLGELKAQRAVQTPPNPAVNAGLVSGSSAQVAPNRDQLKAGYTQEMQAARGNRDQCLAVQAKYKAQGLDIENIGLLT